MTCQIQKNETHNRASFPNWAWTASSFHLRFQLINKIENVFDRIWENYFIEPMGLASPCLTDQQRQRLHKEKKLNVQAHWGAFVGCIL
jgi:hypothetical protein